MLATQLAAQMSQPSQAWRLHAWCLVGALSLFATAWVFEPSGPAQTVNMIALVQLALAVLIGGSLTGWRATQLPKTRASEFYLITPVSDWVIVGGRDPVGHAALGLRAAGGWRPGGRLAVGGRLDHPRPGGRTDVPSHGDRLGHRHWHHCGGLRAVARPAVLRDPGPAADSVLSDRLRAGGHLHALGPQLGAGQHLSNRLADSRAHAQPRDACWPPTAGRTWPWEATWPAFWPWCWPAAAWPCGGWSLGCGPITWKKSLASSARRKTI